MIRRLFPLLLLMLFVGLNFSQAQTTKIKKVVFQGFWWDYKNNNYPNGWANYLAELAPRMGKGAAIVLDDYADWEGCRTAADEFLAANKKFELVRTAPNALIRRVAA